MGYTSPGVTWPGIAKPVCSMELQGHLSYVPCKGGQLSHVSKSVGISATTKPWRLRCHLQALRGTKKPLIWMGMVFPWFPNFAMCKNCSSYADWWACTCHITCFFLRPHSGHSGIPLQLPSLVHDALCKSGHLFMDCSLYNSDTAQPGGCYVALLVYLCACLRYLAIVPWDFIPMGIIRMCGQRRQAPMPRTFWTLVWPERMRTSWHGLGKGKSSIWSAKNHFITSCTYAIARFAVLRHSQPEFHSKNLRDASTGYAEMAMKAHNDSRCMQQLYSSPSFCLDHYNNLKPEARGDSLAGRPCDQLVFHKRELPRYGFHEHGQVFATCQ